MTRIVAGGNAYWHQRGVEVMKMTGSAGVQDNDDDLSSGSFKHSQDLRLGLEPGFVAEAVVPVVAGRGGLGGWGEVRQPDRRRR